ncbi:MAG TPA: hypothetical protein EYP56_00715, partial [Planctomycetaceae bacterium]|nr:hypothetical protein [Planctomycetaceae bacterium]
SLAERPKFRQRPCRLVPAYDAYEACEACEVYEVMNKACQQTGCGGSAIVEGRSEQQDERSDGCTMARPRVMQWRWIDRFIEFQSGRYARAEKYAKLAGSFFEENFPPYGVMPRPLVIEGLAQTGGLLVCEAKGFTTAVILAKIPVAKFFCDAREGDLIRYFAELEYVRSEGAMVRTAAHIGERPYAQVDIVFAHVVTDEGQTPFDPRFFQRMMARLGGFDCWRPADT